MISYYFRLFFFLLHVVFLRLYLITRSIMFHSHLIRDTTLRSFGYLNRVTIDFAFLFKTYLLQRPFRSITVVSTIIFFIGSWSLRACDYNGDRRHFSMSNSMWIFAVTFTTVGYGDIYPSTYCGRSKFNVYSLIWFEFHIFFYSYCSTYRSIWSSSISFINSCFYTKISS